jgi:hypothetical protein
LQTLQLRVPHLFKQHLHGLLQKQNVAHSWASFFDLLASKLNISL